MSDAAAVRELVKEMEALFRSAEERRDGARLRAVKAGRILLDHLNEQGFTAACGVTYKQAARCREYARAWQCAGGQLLDDQPVLPAEWAELVDDEIRSRGRDPERVRFSPDRGKFAEPVVTSEPPSAADPTLEPDPVLGEPGHGSDAGPRKADPDRGSLTIDVILGDCKLALPTVPAKAALIVTSPPYADRRSGGVHPDAYVDWFLARADLMRDALRADGTLIVNIKEHVVDGERHTYVIDLVKAMRSRGWLWTEEWAWHKSNSTPGRWPNRFRDGWERILQFNLQRDFAMYQEEVRKPIGDWADTRMRTLSETDEVRRPSATGSGFAARVANWDDRNVVFPDNVLHVEPSVSVADLVLGRVPAEVLARVVADLVAEGRLREVDNVLHLATECGNTGHSAAFPLAIPEFFIKLFTKPGDIVLDPFCGSGTTGQAALLLARSFVGIDIDERAVNVARTRIEAAASKGRAA